MPDTTPPPAPPTPNEAPSPSPRAKGRRWWLWGCGGLLALLVLIVATAAITIWWIQRPIKPVVLSTEEKKVVEAKMEQMQLAPPLEKTERRVSMPPPGSPPETPSTAAAPKPAPAPVSTYQPGGKELRLTERELNGLLNANTDLGQTVRIALDAGAINAYFVVPIPEDVPMFGGTTFRGRGRFRLSLTAGQPPVAMLEDVTVFGLSLPKEWLGGLKGKNLLADAMGTSGDATSWKGIKSLRVVEGAIVLEVGE